MLPLAVVLEAFNPFVPLDPENSGIPGFVIRFRVKNQSQKPVKVTVVGSLFNPIGFDGLETLDLRTVNGTMALATTCFWLDDGNFHAFEGVNVLAGCCPLNCTHVWNYAQSMAFLFPLTLRIRTSAPFKSVAGIGPFNQSSHRQGGRFVLFLTGSVV